MGESEVFYVGDKTAPELKLNIKLDKKKGTASIMLGGNKISGRPKPFQSASALEKFLETLSK